LQQVIKGWTEGIPYFKEGGSGVLLIPSSLGYGSSTRGPIQEVQYLF
jgi:FKBP-type peptidyl-prolyl cis-trans isomerase FkpA